MTVGRGASARFLLSVEEECLTVAGRTRETADTVGRFLNALSELAPALPGSSGLFNAYGRVYEDVGGHLEFALLECDSPLALVGAIETQYALAARALARLRAEGRALRLSGTKHSGLLQVHTAVWGLHENYLIERPARELCERMLPFLATRVYAGSGGVLFPSGDYVASVRALFMERETDGNTTSARALFSTAREEHHMGPHTPFRRLHLICGDAHRSQFNLALVLGATALALKAVQQDGELPRRLERIPVRKADENWIGVLRRLNHLGGPLDPPRVDPVALAVQRVYLESVERWVATLERPASWIPLILAAWQRTLKALEEGDREWLGRRLDAFIKRDLLEGLLAAEGVSWNELPGQRERFCRLALHDQDYHAIGQADSLFERLERADLIEHRLVSRVEAGNEREPYVPEVETRARPRARLIRDHAGDRTLLLDWSGVLDRKRRKVRRLHDPFAAEFGPWEEPQPEDVPPPLRGRNFEEVLAWLARPSAPAGPGVAEGNPFAPRPSSRPARRTESG